jgi:hypothetical protein
MIGGKSFEERRAAVEQACRALTGVDEALWSACGADLGELMSRLDELAVRVDAARVDVLREAVDRGEAGSGRSGAHAWLPDHCPSLRAGGSARMVRLAETGLDGRYAALVAAVRDARVPLLTASVAVDEFERLAPRLAQGAGSSPCQAGSLCRRVRHAPPRTRSQALGGHVRELPAVYREVARRRPRRHRREGGYPWPLD